MRWEYAVICAFIASASFSLGWFMRGDMIYSAMFSRTVAMMPSIEKR